MSTQKIRPPAILIAKNLVSGKHCLVFGDQAGNESAPEDGYDRRALARRYQELWHVRQLTDLVEAAGKLGPMFTVEAGEPASARLAEPVDVNEDDWINCYSGSADDLLRSLDAPEADALAEERFGERTTRGERGDVTRAVSQYGWNPESDTALLAGKHAAEQGMPSGPFGRARAASLPSPARAEPLGDWLAAVEVAHATAALLTHEKGRSVTSHLGIGRAGRGASPHEAGCPFTGRFSAVRKLRGVVPSEIAGMEFELLLPEGSLYLELFRLWSSPRRRVASLVRSRNEVDVHVPNDMAGNGLYSCSLVTNGDDEAKAARSLGEALVNLHVSELVTVLSEGREDKSLSPGVARMHRDIAMAYMSGDLRLCAYPRCQNPFIRTDPRKEYCSLSCNRQFGRLKSKDESTNEE